MRPNPKERFVLVRQVSLDDGQSWTSTTEYTSPESALTIVRPRIKRLRTLPLHLRKRLSKTEAVLHVLYDPSSYVGDKPKETP